MFAAGAPRPRPKHALALALLLIPAAAAAQDADGDGVDDAVDAFPCDAQADALAYAPGLGAHGMLLAEDQWPVRLDDDYQDLVATYSYGFALASQSSRVTEVRLVVNVLAAGGVFDVGLGLQLPVPASALASATLRIGSAAPVALSARNTDTQLTFTLSSDVRADLFPGATGVVNAIAPSTEPRRSSAGPMELVVRFTTPQSLAIQDAPFDLFLFRADAAAHEVHRPRYCGTSTMDTSLFNTGIDASNPSAARCFIDHAGLPAMLHVPTTAAYALESTNVATLYPSIVPWANSGGTQNQSWYSSPNASAAYPNPLTPTFADGAAYPVDTSCGCPAGYTGTVGSCTPTPSGVSSVFDEAFTSGSPGAACPAWNAFRGQLAASADYSRVTLSGSLDATGVSCTGPAANTLCQALRTNTAVSVSCGGRTWATGSCGSGIELSANGNICQCSTGYVARPCIGNVNWGGVSGATCSAPSQRIRVDCAEGASAPRVLTVTVGGGASGNVTSNPSGVSCGSDCSEGYAYGTSVTLTANTTNGGQFVGWSGACSGTSPTCTVTMDTDRAVTADFVGQGVTAYNASFTSGQNPSGQQCPLWNSWRANLAANIAYQSVTIRGSNDATGATCRGAAANTLCQALRTGTAVSASCDGRTWVTGNCGSGIELSANGGVCQCSAGYVARPCIGNVNWGGVNGATCSAPSQTIEVQCAP